MRRLATVLAFASHHPAHELITVSHLSRRSTDVIAWGYTGVCIAQATRTLSGKQTLPREKDSRGQRDSVMQ